MSIEAVLCGLAAFLVAFLVSSYYFRRGNTAGAHLAFGRHLLDVESSTQKCLIHMEPDVDHCRGCAAEREAALAPVQRLIETAPVMWHGDYPVKAVPVSDLLSALTAAAAPLAGQHTTDEEADDV